MWQYNNPDELHHHGIMGMKWGVRRYQNTDGTLTAKGKARFKEVESDPRLQKRDTKQALGILRKKAKTETTLAVSKELHAERLYKKADKDVWTSEKAQNKGNNQKFQKYQGNAWNKIGRSLTEQKEAKKWLEQANLTYKKISDINSGKIKAGRDFIVQTDYNVAALPIIAPGFVGGLSSVRVDRRIIDKK